MVNFNQHKKADYCYRGASGVEFVFKFMRYFTPEIYPQEKAGGRRSKLLCLFLNLKNIRLLRLNPEQNYKENYDLIKAWYKDLWTAIDDKSTARYIHYIISQVTNHIDPDGEIGGCPYPGEFGQVSEFSGLLQLFFG